MRLYYIVKNTSGGRNKSQYCTLKVYIVNNNINSKMMFDVYIVKKIINYGESGEGMVCGGRSCVCGEYMGCGGGDAVENGGRDGDGSSGV